MSTTVRCCLLVLPSFGASAGAQTPDGDQHQVNLSTVGNQADASSALLNSSGEIVVVWASDSSSGTDTSASSIQLRRIGADGVPIGDEVQVNEFTTDNQIRARVSGLPGGGFLVVWESPGSFGSDSSARSVQGRLFDAFASPVGGEFQLNTYTTDTQHRPDVATRPDGSFVVVWTSFGSWGTDTAGTSVQARIVDSSGVPLEDQFQVNSYTPTQQQVPSVAATPDGGFVVSWSSGGSGHSDRLRARAFDADGLPIGSEFVGSDPEEGIGPTATAAFSSGDFVVAWQTNQVDSYGYQVFEIDARIFDVQGNVLQEVGITDDDDARHPHVSVAPDDSFAVIWQAKPADSKDFKAARFFNAEGTPTTPQFPLEDSTNPNIWQSSLEHLPGGRIVALWASTLSDGDDVDGFSIQARRFKNHHIFADGFESGDVAAWSGTVP